MRASFVSGKNYKNKKYKFINAFLFGMILEQEVVMLKQEKEGNVK